MASRRRRSLPPRPGQRRSASRWWRGRQEACTSLPSSWHR
jgi:hypothetical protein